MHIVHTTQLLRVCVLFTLTLGYLTKQLDYIVGRKPIWLVMPLDAANVLIVTFAQQQMYTYLIEADYIWMVKLLHYFNFSGNFLPVLCIQSSLINCLYCDLCSK